MIFKEGDILITKDQNNTIPLRIVIKYLDGENYVVIEYGKVVLIKTNKRYVNSYYELDIAAMRNDKIQKILK